MTCPGRLSASGASGYDVPASFCRRSRFVKPCKACSPRRSTSKSIRSLRDRGLNAVTVLPFFAFALVVRSSRSRTAKVGSCTWLKASRYLALLCAEISRYRNSNVTLLRRGTHAITSLPSRRTRLRIRNSSGLLITVSTRSTGPLSYILIQLHLTR